MVGGQGSYFGGRELQLSRRPFNVGVGWHFVADDLDGRHGGSEKENKISNEGYFYIVMVWIIG